MANLPAFYIDNVRVIKSRTTYIRGNNISDCYGAEVVGIEASGHDTLRMKDNTVCRLRSQEAECVGISLQSVADALLVYNVLSRCEVGLYCDQVTKLDVYNLTVHNCKQHVALFETTAVFRNVCLSVYADHQYFNAAAGFVVDGTSSADVDFLVHNGLQSVYSGDVTLGDSVYTEKPLYMDEENDDLVPDYLSIQIRTGTDNPLHVDSPDIGGKQGYVTTEATASRSYHYDLLDTVFWDAENDQSVEVILIKALQSRILAAIDTALTAAEKDYYFNALTSSYGFSELFPAYAIYASSSKFKKRIRDLWFATVNQATVQALQNSIGGYNLFPSFFRRLDSISGVWVLDESTLDVDNVLLGYEALKYGICIDVLGTSTISTATSAECYNNVTHCIADLAPNYWQLHNHPQPAYYLLFTDLWNGYEFCDLDNMLYNDDYAISPDVVEQDCQCITPLLTTGALPVSGYVSTIGPAPSGGGYVEVSLLDRIYSESINRSFYYRQGNDAVDIQLDDWHSIPEYIGGRLLLTDRYVQFKINVDSVLRSGDYEFVGLALRRYSTSNIWEDRYTDIDTCILGLSPGESIIAAGSIVYENFIYLSFPNAAGINEASWWFYAPPEFLTNCNGTLRFLFRDTASTSGSVVLTVTVTSYDVLGNVQDVYLDTFEQHIDADSTVFRDVDLSSILSTNTRSCCLVLSRSATSPLDTYNADLNLFGIITT